MSSLCSVIRRAWTWGVAAVVLCGLCPAIASAQSVRGHGQVWLEGSHTLSVSEISVNAWLAAGGFAHRSMAWVGDVTKQRPGGPSDPWFIEVYAVYFYGNTAYVAGVVTHSVFPGDIGSVVASPSPTTVEPARPTRSAASPSKPAISPWTIDSMI